MTPSNPLLRIVPRAVVKLIALIEIARVYLRLNWLSLDNREFYWQGCAECTADSLLAGVAPKCL